MMAQKNLVVDNSSAAQIRSRICPECSLCGTRGEPLYAGLTDRLFGVSGEWNLKRCPNTSCGLIWLDPMPLEEDIGKAYASYFTHAAPEDAPPPAPPAAHTRAAELFRSAYRAWRFNCGDGVGKPFRWLLALPIFLSRLECDWLNIPLRYLVIPDKGRMLDVGCGDGSIVKLAEDLGWKAEGVDFDPDAVAAAQRKGLAVHLGKLADQHYPDSSFNLVLMSHVIEHVHDPFATLGEIRRILQKGGTLVVTTPNAGSWGHRHFGCNFVHLDPPRHLQIFNGRNLAALIRRSGFPQSTVSSTLRITSFTFVISRLIRSSGRGNTPWPPSLLSFGYGRAAAAAELLMRVWDPLVADELLLEARK
jgi:SAM-dependent methyltransferase